MNKTKLKGTKSRKPGKTRRRGFNIKHAILSDIPVSWLGWNEKLTHDARLSSLNFYISIRKNVFGGINQSKLANYLGFHRSVLSRLEDYHKSYITGAAFIKYCYTMQSMQHMSSDDIIEIFKREKLIKEIKTKDRISSLETAMSDLLELLKEKKII